MRSLLIQPCLTLSSRIRPISRFSIYVPLTLPISALIGYVSGSIWAETEWRYVDATRDMDASELDRVGRLS